MTRYELLIVLIFSFAGCQTTQNSSSENNINQVDTGHNSRNSLDWDGIYTESNEHHHYQVGENQLVKLDSDGKPIESEFTDRYVLLKAAMDQSVTDRYWKLIELGSRDLDSAAIMHQEAHLILHSPDNRITGNGSCNNFSGSFELGSQNQISFTQMISTRMACPDMEVEDQLLKVFESADSFSLNKDTLSLLKSGMAAPLARFVAIYFN